MHARSNEGVGCSQRDLGQSTACDSAVAATVVRVSDPENGCSASGGMDGGSGNGPSRDPLLATGPGALQTISVDLWEGSSATTGTRRLALDKRLTCRKTDLG